MRRKGRKRSHYETSWGETILGLGQLSDDRWVELDDRSHPWTCHDERQAIAEFHRRQAKRNGDSIPLTMKRASFEEFDAAPESFYRNEIEVTIDCDGSIELATLVDSNEFWSSIEMLIRNEPQMVARKTGIKQIEWLDDLKKPPPPITLQEVGELFYGIRDAKGVLTEDDKKQRGKAFEDNYEAQRSWNYWREFCNAVSPTKLVKEVSEDDVTAYSEWLKESGFASKTIENRLRKVGSILNYAIARRKAQRGVLGDLKADFNNICKCPNGDDDNANPIYPDDFHFLYQAANLKWRAILLCMLNFAMHPGEAGDMLKPPKELDIHRRTLRSRRTKSRVMRVAMVWQETINAIEAYQNSEDGNLAYKESPNLFLTKYNEPYAAGGLTQYFRESLRPRAEKMAGRELLCTLDCIRDGAQNAADDGGADPFHTEMLMGHKLPKVMGKYKKRTPEKTQKSVECIRKYYGIEQLCKEA